MRHVVVMLATSYPRFPGDGVGSFMEPIAKSVAARGHEVHMVAPWHPAITRGKVEDGVFFHFYKYAPAASLNVFGYAGGLRADTALKAAAWAIAPAALAAGWFKAWRVATKKRATVMHGHWVIPGGVTAMLAAGSRPLVISLHGSDVFVAEQHGAVRRAARAAFARAAWVTACSDDLRTRAIAIGADASRIETVPYGVDAVRFAPNAVTRAAVRRERGLGDAPVVFAAGRLVNKKGFEFLIDAAARLRVDLPSLRVLIAGDGDLRDELAQRAAAIAPAVQLIGNAGQDEVARLCAAADVIAVPSVHDQAGNVDGLPNFALEALASATPVIATGVGGLPAVVRDGLTGRIVAERDAAALAAAIDSLLARPAEARTLGDAARALVMRDYGWARVAERFEMAYDVGAAR
ncbi:MAG TPA: glycosyltransferase [Vicinamibacterales bacterium]|nr:glycosyltransferase [Vicinamibacterales bacterium]